MVLQAAGAAPQHDACLFIQEARDSRDEAEHIARQIGDLLHSGRREREIAVLYRTRHMSRPLEAALRHAHIPYRVRGTTGFYDRAVIRDALAYLRAIANPADSLSLTRIANRPARGLGAQALASFASFAAQNGLPLEAALRHPAALEQVSSKAVQGARTLAGLLTRWQQFARRSYPPDHLLADVLEQSGYSQMLEQRLAPEDLPDARAHLNELLEAAAEHTDLSSFLQEVALLTSADDDDDERSRVELLTIHAAKGLEWPCVFVAGLEEGTLPHERSLPTAEGIEEERRLCYVALTRAGERLFLSWAPGRSRGKTLHRSRFLEEILAYGRERSRR
jgi:DNA helicase-2/ATP-dependent DNA helicase PcrA